jgi:GMP synthase (glutamine-hydrolysing)
MDKITIIDFGGQYAHLISNRIRRLGVYTNIVLNDVKAEELKDSRGIIFSGGPQSVDSEDSPKIDPEIFELDIPIMGICYGHQLFAHNFGGEIGSAPEYGKCELEVLKKDGLFQDCEDIETVWQNHGDAVVKVPEGFEVAAKTKDNEVSSMQHKEKPWFSVQFHPEVTHSGELGKKLFHNFVFNICKAEKSWSMEKYLKDLRTEIKDFVADKNVFLLVSGGVDSTVCFALLNEILGKERVFGLHIDGGFMRKEESAKVKEILDEKGFDNLEIYDAEDDFIGALKEVYEPEKKRKIIGKMYLEVKDKALEKYDLDPNKWLLAQGTIYPDTIESGGTKNADTIKTHHNRVDQIQDSHRNALKEYIDFVSNEKLFKTKFVDLGTGLLQSKIIPTQ